MMTVPILFLNLTAVHGGAEEVLVTYMEAARELGFQPVLVVPQTGWLTGRCRELGIPCELLPTLPDAFAVDTLRLQAKTWLLNGIAIAQLARKWQAGLVHSNSPRASYHGGLGARLARIPAITHVHDADPERLPYAHRVKARILLPLTDHLLAVSASVAASVCQLEPRLGNRIQVLYNGWDISRYNTVAPVDVRTPFGFHDDAIVVGNVATMYPWKGQSLLIEAVRQTLPAISQLRLIIVGGSQGSPEQEAYIARLHREVAQARIEAVVAFTGWRDDSWSLTRSFDLFAHVPTRPDPLPTTVLHAAALGAAIIGSRTGGIPEIVIDEESGLLVPPDDAPALSHTLTRLALNPELRLRLGAAATRRFQEHFSKQRLVDGLAAAYEQCLALTKPHREVSRWHT